MKKILLLFLLCGIFNANTEGQMFDYKNGLGFRKTFLDYNTLNDKDFSAFREYSGGVEIVLHRNLSKSLALEVPIGLVFINENQDGNTNDPTITIGGQAQYHFYKSSRWLNPYMVGGLNVAIPKLNDFNIAVPLGLGINFNLHPQVSIQWQSDYRLPIANGNNYIQHSLGLIYMLGAKKEKATTPQELEKPMDSDGDGIVDNLDLCPSQAGLPEFKGCPDQDGDGIADKDDRCPETPGSKALKGCPDSDMDGIADSDDECPNEKGLKEYKGCPAPDKDKDGITDKDDNCPDEAGTKEANGCPDRDGDGVPDKVDKCIDEPGVKSKGGCPDKKEEKPQMKDSDGDGVVDSKDDCPDKAGTIEMGGCPDSDGDGISDKKDKCPDQAAPNTKDGCPEKKMEKPMPKDTDGDGVPDDKDECPDKAGAASMSGCPDSDGDGISDKKDKCPEQAAPNTKDGCPDKKMEKPMPKDTDGDGVPDDKDECPDKAGAASMSGCPDSDGDGISDKKDKCPDQAAPNTKDGCPEKKMDKPMPKDSDNDGIMDDKDDCPFAAGLAKFNGCPDSDGDGITDKLDECPKDAGPASNKGCPVIEKKDLDVLDYAMRAVQFDLSRSTLRDESFGILDKIATVLFKYPAYNLVISGHTDNTGSEKLNIDLSTRRAKVCMDYLITRGVPSTRMSYIGHGSSQPVADNKTDTGRFLNRRTEFSLVVPR